MSIGLSILCDIVSIQGQAWKKIFLKLLSNLKKFINRRFSAIVLYAQSISQSGSVDHSLVRKIVSKFIQQRLKISKLRNFQTKRSVSVAQTQSLLVRNYFQFLVQQRFSNSNLRQISDYKSISVLIKSNVAFIRPFFTALYPSKLLF